MNDAYKQALGKVIEARRRAQGISKQQLSLMVDISRLTLRRIERGQANPSLDILLRICQGLDASFAEIVNDCEQSIAD